MPSPEVEGRGTDRTTERGRHAEIAGGGLGGLAAAAALAQRGWTVRIHERAAHIRASGAGIYIAENGLRTLEALSAYDEALKDGYRFFRREVRDEKGRVLTADEWPLETKFRIYVLRRETLVKALLNVAVRSGVEIRYNSRAVSASPHGVLRLESGEEFLADLVIGADGVHSPIRESLKICGTKKPLAAGAIRAIIPRCDDSQLLGRHSYMEVWSGVRRLFYAPISNSEVFVALMTFRSDKEGSQEPPNLETWKRSFPVMKEVLDRYDNAIPWAPFIEVKLASWRKGKVALVGDAAHAMSPNLGQGGGTAMMDGLSLAYHLSRPGPLAAGLAAWETSHRPVVDRVQLVSKIYGTFMSWPPGARKIAFGLLGRNRWVRRQRYIAANYVPDGADERPISPASERGRIAMRA